MTDSHYTTSHSAAEIVEALRDGAHLVTVCGRRRGDDNLFILSAELEKGDAVAEVFGWFLQEHHAKIADAFLLQRFLVRCCALSEEEAEQLLTARRASTLSQ